MRERHRRNRCMNGIRSMRVILAIVVLLMALYLPEPAVAATAPGQVVDQYGPFGVTVPRWQAVHADPRAQPVDVSLSARAAFVVDLANQAELFAKAPDQSLPPASTTKIVTALVVVRNADLDEIVSIQADDTVDRLVYSNMDLQAGDAVSIEGLLHGLMINSGGDAALALARHVGETLPGDNGSPPRARFVAEMNRLAQEMGMSGSNFLNPDGRDQEGHVSTARDLAIAATSLFDQPVLERIVSFQSASVQIDGPAAREVTLVNTNELLTFSSVHGVKTGTTGNAGQCVVTAVWRNGARLITVVLGSDDRYGDTQAVLDALDQRYQWVKLGRGGDLPTLQEAVDRFGVELMTGTTMLLTADQTASLRYQLTIESARDSAFRWNRRGEVVFYVGGEPILRLPVFDV